LFFFGHLLVALGLGVNLGATQAAGINQPGGWVHEKGQQGQRLGQIKMPDVHWGGRSPIVKIKGLAFFFFKAGWGTHWGCQRAKWGIYRRGAGCMGSAKMAV